MATRWKEPRRVELQPTVRGPSKRSCLSVAPVCQQLGKKTFYMTGSADPEDENEAKAAKLKKLKSQVMMI